jgi:hypothetical protein
MANAIENTEVLLNELEYGGQSLPGELLLHPR